MKLSKRLRGKIEWKAVAPSIILILNSFVWYIFSHAVFYSTITALYPKEGSFFSPAALTLLALYYIGVAVSAIVGAKVLSIKRTRFLVYWSFMGTVATLSLVMLTGENFIVNVLISIFFGVSLGLGLPSCLSYFAELVAIEKRGFASGVVWSSVGFAILFLAFLTKDIGNFLTIVTLSIWRLLGGIEFRIFNRQNPQLKTINSPSYLGLLTRRELLMYLIPWVLFSLINFGEAPFLETFYLSANIDYIFLQAIQWGIVGFIAVFGGLLSDIIGRKRVIIAGFVMLGIEYAAISTFDGYQALYFFMILGGVSWGLLVSVFFTTLWGDLGENYEKSKYYALGGLPFLLSGFLGAVLSPYAAGIRQETAFSIASFLLFLAVLPLFYARETLPEKKIREREILMYVESAQKIKQKYS